ncbi:MAG: LytTR family DNA-binding domain-containing protein [Bacteroidota bacterium]
MALVIGLSIVQDFIFSKIRNTGFYLSDTLLYNTIWIFLIPITFLEIGFFSRCKYKTKIAFPFAILATSGILALLHILLFTTCFVSVSYLVFSPAHRFVRIFNSALSSEFSILVLYYFGVPIVSKLLTYPLDNTSKRSMYSKQIKVKEGRITIVIDTDTIETIATDKPYTLIATHKNSFYDNRTLKEFMTFLNPNEFLRVNRSTIVNKKAITQLTSRKNGDYDAVLHTNKTIRLSRHYRVNWKMLLQ